MPHCCFLSCDFKVDPKYLGKPPKILVSPFKLKDVNMLCMIINHISPSVLSSVQCARPKSDSSG